jgi:hypothetical protein
MAMTAEEKKARAEARKQARLAEKERLEREAEKNQKPVKSLTISIDWIKSRTWGANPHASVTVEYKDGTHTTAEGFTAGGCGYDKESTVIAEIFNQFLKYKLWAMPLSKVIGGKGSLDKGPAPYGINAGHRERGEYRYYAGGIGTDCYKRIGEYIGGKFERMASGKRFDVFQYVDGN